MIAKRSESGWRVSALAAALLASTINFLQPRVHAAAMRDGMPAALRTAFWPSSAADPAGTPAEAPQAGGRTRVRPSAGHGAGAARVNSVRSRCLRAR